MVRVSILAVIGRNTIAIVWHICPDKCDHTIPNAARHLRGVIADVICSTSPLGELIFSGLRHSAGGTSTPINAEALKKSFGGGIRVDNRY